MPLGWYSEYKTISVQFYGAEIFAQQNQFLEHTNSCSSLVVFQERFSSIAISNVY